MRQQKILMLLFYVLFVLLYLAFSTKFKRGWTKKGVIVKGAKVNVLLFILVAFIVLTILMLVPM
jgi:hypothetical protein